MLADYSQREELFKEAAPRWKSLCESAKPQLDLKEATKITHAYPCIKYGVCLLRMGKVEEGVRAFKRGIDAVKAAYGSQHFKVTETYLWLGGELKNYRRPE